MKPTGYNTDVPASIKPPSMHVCTGRGGKSIYPTANGKFPDEISDNFKFAKRGVVAMANSGPNTNGR